MMSSQVIRITSICITFILLSGCIGVMVQTPGPERVAEPPFIINTREKVIFFYGEPDEVKITGNTERWRIYRRLNIHNWCGILVAVGITVPLMLPVCEGYFEFDFEGENVIGKRYKSGERKGLICGAIGKDLRLACETEDPKR